MTLLLIIISALAALKIALKLAWWKTLLGFITVIIAVLLLMLI